MLDVDDTERFGFPFTSGPITPLATNAVIRLLPAFVTNSRPAHALLFSPAHSNRHSFSLGYSMWGQDLSGKSRARLLHEPLFMSNGPNALPVSLHPRARPAVLNTIGNPRSFAVTDIYDRRPNDEASRRDHSPPSPHGIHCSNTCQTQIIPTPHRAYPPLDEVAPSSQDPISNIVRASAGGRLAPDLYKALSRDYHVGRRSAARTSGLLRTEELARETSSVVPADPSVPSQLALSSFPKAASVQDCGLRLRCPYSRSRSAVAPTTNDHARPDDPLQARTPRAHLDAWSYLDAWA
ncbi:hypothetical protein BJ912DRAFT_1106191 [Pholiota molesta]|nr:hypothetical protein BJ912DRAFT_1106191 [Pholiota molesta]